MSIFSLILGVLLGALSVMFVLQNVAVVTVSFLAWQVTASLALILLATLLSGVIVTLLILLPGLVRDEIQFAALRRQMKEKDVEIERQRQAQTSTTMSAPQI